MSVKTKRALFDAYGPAPPGSYPLLRRNHNEMQLTSAWRDTDTSQVRHVLRVDRYFRVSALGNPSLTRIAASGNICRAPVCARQWMYGV